MKQFALVLGGGAAKGYAHIGILKVLEKHNLIPDLIVGTSMGALVGGLFSIGKTTQDMELLASKFNNMGNFSVISTLFKGNILNVKKVKAILNKEFQEITHKQAKIKFVAVATNIKTGKPKNFESGLMKNSVLASISIPGIFPTVKIGDDVYCDGGLVNNLAEDVAREIMPDAVILSVDVLGDYEKQVEKIKLKTLEHVINATTIMTINVVKNKPIFANKRITISLPNVSQLNFSSKLAAQTIKKGEQIAKKHIKEIKSLLGVEDGYIKTNEKNCQEQTSNNSVARSQSRRKS